MRGGYFLPLSYFFFCFKLTHKDTCARSYPNGRGIQIPIVQVQPHLESQCQLAHMKCPHCHIKLTSRNTCDEIVVTGKLIHITCIITCSAYYGVEHFFSSSHSRVFTST